MPAPAQLNVMRLLPAGTDKKTGTFSFSRGVMDLTFFLIVMTLLVIGIIMMFSASYAKALNESGGTNGTSYATKQITMAAIGIFCMFFFSFLIIVILPIRKLL